MKLHDPTTLHIDITIYKVQPLAIRMTRITRMIVGLIGIIPALISSRTIPTIEKTTMTTSS